MNVYFEYLRK